jgi:hypothetical protein
MDISGLGKYFTGRSVQMPDGVCFAKYMWGWDSGSHQDEKNVSLITA